LFGLALSYFLLCRKRRWRSIDSDQQPLGGIEFGETKTFAVEDVKVLRKVVGHGNEAVSQLCKIENRVTAVIKIPKEGRQYRNKQDHELQILTTLGNHDNLMKIYGVVFIESSRCLLVEWYELGSLKDYLAPKNSLSCCGTVSSDDLTERQRFSRLARDICSGGCVGVLAARVHTHA